MEEDNNMFLMGYLNYLKSFIMENQDPRAIPLRYEDLYNDTNDIASQIYEIVCLALKK
jgi:hypothetical protein